MRAPSVGWGSFEAIGALVAGGLLLLGFVAWERRGHDAMLPMHYFRRRGFAAPNALAFIQQISG